jgi:hypothetical protein
MRGVALCAVVLLCGCSNDRVPPGTRGTCYDPAGKAVFMFDVSFMPEGRNEWDRHSAFVDPGDSLLVLADPAPASTAGDADRNIQVRVLSGRSLDYVGAIKRRFFVAAR